jgi:hypothetical protein
MGAFVLGLLLCGLSIAAVFAFHVRRRRKSGVGMVNYVHVVTSVDAPNRNLSATLPRRSQATADADRHFGYEGVRTPRYRPNMDPERAELLRPLQIIRVANEAEREALEKQTPPHINAVFVENGRTPATAAYAAQRRGPSGQ